MCSFVPDNLCILLVLAFAVPPFAKHNWGIHIGWGEGVWLVEQRDHTKQDGPDYQHVRTHATHTHTHRESKWGHCNIRCRCHMKENLYTSFLKPQKLYPSSERGVTSPLSPRGSITFYTQSAQVFKHRLGTLMQLCVSCWYAKFRRNSETYPTVVSTATDRIQNKEMVEDNYIQFLISFMKIK